MSNQGINIYIAAPIGSIAYANSIAAELTARGHKITSSWHAGELLAPTDSELSQEQRKKIANTAFEEILSSHALLLIAKKDGRGSLFEAGVAVGAGINVIAIGDHMAVTAMLECEHGITWAIFKEDAFAEIDKIAINANRFHGDEYVSDWDSDYNDDSDDHG